MIVSNDKDWMMIKRIEVGWMDGWMDGWMWGKGKKEERKKMVKVLFFFFWLFLVCFVIKLKIER